MKPSRKLFLLLLALCLGLGLSGGLLRAFGMPVTLTPIDWPVEGQKPGQTAMWGRDLSSGFGRVMTVADVNGDSYDDLIASAPYSSQAGGEIYVVPGPLSFNDTFTIPARTALIFQETTHPQAQFGEYLASGDINGDGLDDIAMGSWITEKAYVYLGSTDIQASNPITILVNSQNMALTVSPVNSGLVLCDFNADGYQDVFVTQFDLYSFDLGLQVWGVFGSPGLTATLPVSLSMPTDANVRIEGIHPSEWGMPNINNLACGDINGDGTDDLVLGVYGEGRQEFTSPGVVYIIPGNPVLTTSSPITLTMPDQAGAIIDGFDGTIGTSGDFLGESLAVVDVNLDGRDDLIIAAPGASGPDNLIYRAGEVYLWLGRDLNGQRFIISTQASWIVYGEKYNDHLGLALTTGDYDGDDFPEILVGCPGCDEFEDPWYLTGKGFVLEPLEISGMVTATAAAQLTLSPDIYSSGLGSDVETMDIDSDGYDDLLLSAPFIAYPEDLAGAIYAVSYPIRTRVFLPFVQH